MGQIRISCILILCKKCDETEAWIVAISFENAEDVSFDSNTVDEVDWRTYLSIAAEEAGSTAIAKETKI